MLTTLVIQNIVLIEKLTMTLDRGLCVLTGETGAGKSILLDSLGLVLGARADSGMVRKGQDQASVTAVFDLPVAHPVFQILKDHDLSSDGDLILKRVLTADGRSRAFVNDQPVSVNLLKTIGESLAEIHGQFDTHSLLNPQSHGVLLDDFAGHDSLCRSVATLWEQVKATRQTLEDLKTRMAQARTEEQYYREALEDLDALDPREGEEEGLTAQRNRLMQKEQILGNMVEVQSILNGLEDQAAKAWKFLNKMGEAGTMAQESLDRALIEMGEAQAALQSVADLFEDGEASLSVIDDRLHALKAQAKKHGCAMSDLPAKRQEIMAYLKTLDHQEDTLSQAIIHEEKARRAFEAEAKILSQSRQKSAKELKKKIEKEFPPLKLDKAQMEIVVEQTEPSATGIDRIQFLIATNPGSDPAPLNKIASGGEMARFMLAMKVVLAQAADHIGTLVFDEVDSGVGGATAAAVGERLSRLADGRQVLVVTHSPQVAARGAAHWIVSKSGEKGTVTHITPIKNDVERREEIARMLSGSEITQEARAAAQKLLEAG